MGRAILHVKSVNKENRKWNVVQQYSSFVNWDLSSVQKQRPGTKMSAFDENPFADPSVQQAVGTGTKTANLEDYNPFDAQKNQTASGNNAGNGPAVKNPPHHHIQNQDSSRYQQLIFRDVKKS